MYSIAVDYYDYNMGNYDCSEGFYRYKVDGDYGCYENSHDQGTSRFEDYGFEGENKVNIKPSAYGEYGDDGARCDGFYDENGTYGESCTTQADLELEFGITHLFAKLMRAMVRVHMRSVKIHILHLLVSLIKFEMVLMVIPAIVEVVL
ncbi:hypothetical protein FXO37_36696 [Capsicum annuum]|nr:hypothetical protein FXO37_36696 [Capsicum annuum]